MDILPSLPSFYLSAPTSPYGCSPETLRFYSMGASPVHIGSKTNDEEFEFGTNQWDDYKLPARANSFSTMAFADELFCDGHVLPLKLPPRLQSSVPTSPSSLRSRTRKPLWNDSFDPFMIALEKVSEETQGRMSVHRRSRSYSPFRTHTSPDNLQKPNPTRPEPKKPTISTDMVERKGSMYSRWVRTQTMVRRPEVTPAGPTTMKRLWLGRRVRDADFSHGKPMDLICTESKIQKVKSVLLRYALLKKESDESKKMMTISKFSYFKQLSLSFKSKRKQTPKISSS